MAATDFRSILADAQALKESMDLVRSGNTPDHAKWAAFRDFAQSYNEIANLYSIKSKESDIKVWNIDSMPNYMNSLWPNQKQIFDTTYSEVCKIINRINSTSKNIEKTVISFRDLLHPKIESCSSFHYESGDYRNAVLDSIIAVFDCIRDKTGLDQDGEVLINNVFSAQGPYLIISELDTDSGRNEQRGFQEMLKGFYRGVRNPKAHSLVHDLDAIKSGQYLVLASLLMRSILEASPTDRRRNSLG